MSDSVDQMPEIKHNSIRVIHILTEKASCHKNQFKGGQVWDFALPHKI